MNKSYILLLIMFLLVIFGSGCSSSSTPDPNQDQPQEQPQAPSGEDSGVLMRSVRDCGLGQNFDNPNVATGANILFLTTLPATGLSSSSSASSDTSCRMSSPPQSQDQAISTFILHSYVYLEEEASKGNGEYIQALAQLYGCLPKSQSILINSIRQSYVDHLQNHSEIHNQSERAKNLKDTIRTHISKNSLLAKTCKIS